MSVYSGEKGSLEDADGGSHGALDVERLDVLPVLLQQGDQEVDGSHGVGNQLILSHLGVTNGNTQAENLLQLELDGALHLGNLLIQVVRVGDGGGELAGLVQTGSEKTGNLLDDDIGGEEDIKRLGQLLHQLLILVQLLQILNRLEGNVQGLGLVTVHLITENADAHVGLGHVGEADGTGKTLITLRIVVLQTNLQLDSLVKVALSLGISGGGQDGGEGLTHSRGGDLTIQTLEYAVQRGWMDGGGVGG